MTGKDLRALRVKMHLTQLEFAKLFGFSRYAWISALENGRAPISKRTEIIYKNLFDKQTYKEIAEKSI